MATDVFGQLALGRNQNPYFNALLQQGTDTSPIQSPYQGLSRLAFALLTGMESRDEQQKRAASGQAIANALTGMGGDTGSAPVPTPQVGAPVAGAPGVTGVPWPGGGAAPQLAGGPPSAPRGIRNNNPLNIEAGNFTQSQPGYQGSDGRFAKFASMDQGVGAASKLLDTYGSKYGLNTVSGIVNRWAPPGENNSGAYASAVAKDMGLDPNQPLNMADPNVKQALIGAMAKYENGRPIQMAQAVPSQQLSPGQRTIPGMPQNIKNLIQTLSSSGDDAQISQAIALAQPWTKPKDVPIPDSVREYQYYLSGNPQNPMDYATWATQKARAGATQIANNVDLSGPQKADTMAAEAVLNRIKPLMDVEATKKRQLALNQMQGAIDAIVKSGGTTGGLGQDQILELKKTLNSAGNVIGLQPFSEEDIANKEVLSKANRQLAGAAAKGDVGARVTNFEFGNYLKANPGLATSPTFTQRLVGIQSQVEQRNQELGNKISDMFAQDLENGRRVNLSGALKLIREYDEANHIVDPITGQDLTKSYTVPDLQTPTAQDAAKSTNTQMEIGHQKNINGIKIQRVK